MGMMGLKLKHLHSVTVWYKNKSKVWFHGFSKYLQLFSLNACLPGHSPRRSSKSKIQVGSNDLK